MYGVKSQLPTRVVRGWGERRLRQAFRLALRDRGFDAEGRILGGGEQRLQEEGNGGKGRSLRPLKGTVRLQVMKPIISLRGKDVREQATLAVDRIVALCSENNSTSEKRRKR